MIQRLEEAQKTLVIRDLEDVLTEAHIFGVKHPQLEDHGAWVRFLWSNLFCKLQTVTLAFAIELHHILEVLLATLRGI